MNYESLGIYSYFHKIHLYGIFTYMLTCPENHRNKNAVFGHLGSIKHHSQFRWIPRIPRELFLMSLYVCWSTFWNKKTWTCIGDYIIDPRLSLNLAKNPPIYTSRCNPNQTFTTWVFPKIVGFPPKIIHFNRVFHYKPSIFGVPLFLETSISWRGNTWSFTTQSCCSILSRNDLSFPTIHFMTVGSGFNVFLNGKPETV